MSGGRSEGLEDAGRGWLIGIDTGGTFTDAVAFAPDGSTRAAKVPSTPADPAGALVEALRDLAAAGVDLGRATLLVHGSTIATNALIQRTLPRVVLVATRGFRDVIAIGTGMRRDVYDLWAAPGAPLVAAADRLEVGGRIGPSGEIVEPLTRRELAEVVRAVAARDPEIVAVACLFAYANDEHERRIAAALRARLPRVAVTRSSEIAREFREYPRTHTTVVAAALRPLAAAYVVSAVSRVRRAGVSAPMLVMLSNGGSAPARRAARMPHALVLSGPAAGVAAAAALGRRLRVRDLISLDMGGTSTDVCLVRGGVPPVAGSRDHDGAPILAPAVDIVTIGAGGGSIATVDPGSSVLRVGPASAGADPGPAAYGLGGEEPTVTDAHVVAGHLGASTALAGRLLLHTRLAERAVARLAGQLGCPVPEAAEAVLALAGAHLARAVRRVSVDRGVDPRGGTLVALGGAGPLQAAALVRELGLREAIVPRHPGFGSAAGLLAADLRLDSSQTILRRLDPVTTRSIVAWFRRAQRRIEASLARDGIPARRRRFAALAECRYVGQGYELQVPLAAVTPEDVAALAPAFHALHRRTYGHNAPDEPVEAVTLRLSGFGELPITPPARLARGRGRPSTAARLDERPARLSGMRRAVSVPVWRRDALRGGDRLAGPCIVEQLDATTLVLDDMEARVDSLGNLRIREAG